VNVKSVGFWGAAVVFAVLDAFSLANLAPGQDDIGPLIQAERQWSVKSGQDVIKLDARLIGLKQGTVEFEDKQGRKRTWQLSELEPEDRRRALIDRVGSGVVMIATKDVFEKPAAFGSGFVLHASGLVLTNYHVIAGAASITATFRDQAEAVGAELLSVDRTRDIAFLRVPALPAGVHVVELKSQQLPVPGSTVWAIGHPDGLKNTVSWGNVSAVRKTSDLPAPIQQAIKMSAENQWLQTSAVLAQGSSGGPLLDEAGQAVGVNTFVVGPQLGFAIHISEARQAYLEARQNKPQKLPLPPGDMEDAMAWNSAEVAPLVKSLAEEFQRLQNAAPGLAPQDANAQLQAIREKYRGQFLDLARASPQGWPGVQSLAYTAGLCNDERHGAVLEEIGRLALEHHRASRHIMAVVNEAYKHPSEPAREFCRRVAEATPHDEVRAGARFSLGVNLLHCLQAPDTLELAGIQRRRAELERIIADLDAAAKEGPAKGSEAGDPAAVQSLAQVLREQLATIRIGLAAPEIEGVDIQGTQFKLSDYRGKIILLDFFADWCPYCRQMYPGERAMVERWKDRPFALLGVHCESQQVLDRLTKDKTVTWRSWADGQNGPIARQWGISGYPTILLIDRAGLIRWRSSGVPNEQELSAHVEQLLAEGDAQQPGQ
jgi:S1-C subfamily serine protease/thiol-disulfide isomerase/thioredoxin